MFESSPDFNTCSSVMLYSCNIKVFERNLTTQYLSFIGYVVLMQQYLPVYASDATLSLMISSTII